MNSKSTINYNLSLNDTLLIKGIAICFMLWHHLFYRHLEYGDFIYFSSQIGKVCVSLFLFLSAYGLTIQFSKLAEKSLLSSLKFQAIRFLKFYANYWIVFIVVVPIGVFVLGRTLEEAYSTNNVLLPFIRDILGVNYLKSYNVTWWFNSLIICCYLIFPVLFIVTKKKSIWILIIMLIFHLMPIYVNNPLVELLKTYILIFSLGVIYALNHKTIGGVLSKMNPLILAILLGVAFITLSILREKHLVPIFWGMRVDPFLTLIVVFFSMIVLRDIPYFNVGMRYLGKHSMNIYMVHSFIYFYFYSEFIYSFKYPVLIFGALLLISLGISIIIESLKNIIGFDNLIKKVSNLIKR